MGAKARAFKHQLGFDRVRSIAEALAAGSSEFDQVAFLSRAGQELEEMELKARVRHVIACLEKTLPQPFPRAISVILAAIELDGNVRQGDARILRGFAAWPLIDYVGEHGLEYRDLSLRAMSDMTERFSAEFAVRPFLDRFPAETLAVLATFATHENEHVRRLVSEGTRPLLPWGMHLTRFRKDPAPVVALLETLKRDSSEYVRRSVANNLNDIAKDHPAVVVEVCARWTGEGVDPRLIRRALRTLVKRGDRRALAILGFDASLSVEVSAFRLTPRSVREGQTVTIHFEITSAADRTQRLNVDYAVHFVKANGGRSAKVFKLGVFELQPGQGRTVRKKHSMKRVTTRVHYPGTHTVELLVNGNSLASADFELESSAP